VGVVLLKTSEVTNNKRAVPASPKEEDEKTSWIQF
jgi:hypothetical protein